MKLRTAALALAFSATVSAAITGATLRGESRGSTLTEACGFATWPAIPVQCLGGNAKADVRVIGIESETVRTLKSRFVVAFGAELGG